MEQSNRWPIMVIGFTLLAGPLMASVMAHEAAAGALWLIGAESDTQTPTKSAKLQALLKRVGPNMRASADYHDFRDVQLNESLEAWRLLHQRAVQFAQQQVAFYEPKVDSLLAEAKVSLACRRAANVTFAAIDRLDSWAVRMWSSSGTFPAAGLFDGQFTDLGSYRGCVDIETGGSGERFVGHTSYCMLAFRPIVPARNRFHMIFHREGRQLLELFGRQDTLRSVLEWAQYFHYVYLKTGLCVPHECTPHDLQQVAQVIGGRLALMAGPVKCFTKAPPSLGSSETATSDSDNKHADNMPLLIESKKAINPKQLVSLWIVGSFFALVFLATAWHGIELALRHDATKWHAKMNNNNTSTKKTHTLEFFSQNNNDNKSIAHEHSTEAHREVCMDQFEEDCCMPPKGAEQITCCLGALRHVTFEYFSMITNGKQFFDTSMRPNEIECLHGLRVLTMIWIICVHTLQYNEWSGFTRIFENVNSLQNPLIHPMINANYVVDNFFLMSGLLAAYTVCNSNKITKSTPPMGLIDAFTCLLGRYLRLTPQVLLMSLLLIILPLAGDGPFWYDMTHYEAVNCEQNWWINLLHLQSFYKTDKICNLVGWWISVDMLYYVIALFLIAMISRKQLRLEALGATIALVTYCTLVAVSRHYSGGFTPNNLGTVPQINEVWTEFVINYVWTPYPHAFVFFLGLWLGFALANNIGRHQVRHCSWWAWWLASLSMLFVNYSSFAWMSGAVDLGAQWLLTSYNIVCTMVWACGFSWIIVACHYGCGPNLNGFLSRGSFILISKASFIIYLSHMLVVRSLYGLQYTLLEVSTVTVSLIMVGNILLSIMLGIFLNVAFEGPWLKFQRFLLNTIKQHTNGHYHHQRDAQKTRKFCENTDQATGGQHPNNEKEKPQEEENILSGSAYTSVR